MLIKSNFDGANFKTRITWNPLDVPTSEELTKIYKTKSEADQTYWEIGAVDDQEIRNKLINDPTSGFNGLNAELPTDAKPHGKEAGGNGE